MNSHTSSTYLLHLGPFTLPSFSVTNHELELSVFLAKASFSLMYYIPSLFTTKGMIPSILTPFSWIIVMPSLLGYSHHHTNCCNFPH